MPDTWFGVYHAWQLTINHWPLIPSLGLGQASDVISAISKQPSVCRVGANLVFALFLCGVGFIRTRISQMARMDVNNRVCHSERHPLSFRTSWGISPRTPSAFVPSASGGEPTEQRAGRKKIRLSEAKQVTWFSDLQASRRRVKRTKPWPFGYFWVKPKVTEKRFFASLWMTN